MSEAAIKVEHVSKSFKLPHEKNSSLKSVFVNIFKKRRTFEKQTVLKDVSFQIKRGEFFGIVGRNGSGKSTLLKLLAGIYSPDSGAIHINGKLTPFIELGVGFNPELTGRENVYLNGALLGFNRKEMDVMYDEIVKFAELEKFMDQKIKNYSSGMQVRLAFSIAIRADTEIMLIDEVLAVGDQSFQEKCYKYFANIKEADKTIIFVTHDMGSVERFCDRVLLLDKSQTENGIYPVREAVSQYNELNYQPTASKERHHDGSKNLNIESVDLIDKSGNVSNKFTQGEPLTVRVKVKASKDNKINDFTLGLAFHDTDNVNLAGPNSIGQKFNISKATVDYRIASLPFNLGEYYLTVALYDDGANELQDLRDKDISFFVNTSEIRHGKYILDGAWKNH